MLSRPSAKVAVMSKPTRLDQGPDSQAQRTRAESDRRGQIAHLTDDGWQTMLETYPPHLRTVRTRIMRHQRELDLTAFSKAMERIADEEA
jgi:hypothetical protein